MRFYGNNSLGNTRINFLEWTRVHKDVTCYKTINIIGGNLLITTTLSSPDATNIYIQKINFIILQSDKVEITDGINFKGNTVKGNSLHGDFVYADSFRCRNYNVDTPSLGGNVGEIGRITVLFYKDLIEDLRLLRSTIINNG